MIGNILAMALAALTLGLGLKAVLPGGLPISPSKSITGPAAKTIGAILLLLGSGFVLLAIWEWTRATPGGA